MLKILLLLLCIAFVSYLTIFIPRRLKRDRSALVRYFIFAGLALLGIMIVLKIIF